MESYFENKVADANEFAKDRAYTALLMLAGALEQIEISSDLFLDACSSIDEEFENRCRNLAFEYKARCEGVLFGYKLHTGRGVEANFSHIMKETDWLLDRFESLRELNVKAELADWKWKASSRIAAFKALS